MHIEQNLYICARMLLASLGWELPRASQNKYAPFVVFKLKRYNGEEFNLNKLKKVKFMLKL